ncbi:MAG TPA: chorismate synthase [Acidobacteriota bacterium]|nr:chorismate synthase [Acidobacteriota bacterium]
MFRFTTAGESHGKALVTIVEGVPSGLMIETSQINHQLWRRQQGYGRGGRMKIETDAVEVLSGIRHGKALGSPITLLITNRDFANWQTVMASDAIPEWEAIEGDTKKSRQVKRPRPGHADLPGGVKYATRDLRDILERSSARETAARVAAGAVARAVLAPFGIELISHVTMLGGIPSGQRLTSATWEQIAAIQDNTVMRCVDAELEKQMVAAVDDARQNGDTLGGTFEVVVRGLPVGLGSHTRWDARLSARLAQAIMSIQAVKAFEIGAGVEVSRLPGSQTHDEIGYNSETQQYTRLTNRAGGLEGGMTNGQELRVRGHLKPISTLRKPLKSVDIETKAEVEAAFERSDITAVPAAGVIGEAMVALVLAEAMREKFGGDSIQEMQRNFNTYADQVAAY